MTVIHVPKPSQSAIDKNRPVNALLKTQVDHLYQAELKLPIRYQSNIYPNAIKTEGEAAGYIRAVTEAIHQAHEDAANERAKRAPRPGRVSKIAASARKSQSRSKRKQSSKTKKK